MSIQNLAEPLAADTSFRLVEADRMLTPALLIDRDRVHHNIATTLRLLGGKANLWRPHVKTAKLGHIMHMLVDAGVSQMKCATGLELSVACQAGARDVLVAYPLVGANAARVSVGMRPIRRSPETRAAKARTSALALAIWPTASMQCR